MGRIFQRAATATWTGALGDCDDDDDRDTIVDIPAGARDPHWAAPLSLGPYRLLGVLGEGGMARVYLAEHTVLAKRVAIKTLLPAFAPCREAHEMLVREARVTAAIRHPGLIDVYDIATDERGCPYCVMELAPGVTLAQRLARRPLVVGTCLDLVARLADAVEAVHRAGYLHLDIKSENVLLTRSQEGLVPKLIDFGIARPIAEAARDEAAGTLVGTPRTMAPEQIAVDTVDERTDIWALGMLLYEMLTGHLPFPSGATIREELVAILTEAPAPLPPTIPASVRDVVLACLRKDPEGRPPSASTLGAALRACARRIHAKYYSPVSSPS